MSIAEDKARIDGAKEALAAFLTANDVAVPEGTKLDGLVALLEDLPTGGDINGHKYACGTVTPSSNTSSYTFQHEDLGSATVPFFVMWIQPHADANKKTIGHAVFSYYMPYLPAGASRSHTLVNNSNIPGASFFSGYIASATNTSIQLTIGLAAGITYNWLRVAN